MRQYEWIKYINHKKKVKKVGRGSGSRPLLRGSTTALKPLYNRHD